jgi:hypothetical protein
MSDLPALAAATVLLTLGRLPKGLDIARALAAAGCRVLVAEPSAWHHLRLSRSVSRSFRVTAPNTDREAYLDGIAGIVRRERVDLVVPVSEETMHLAHVRPRLGEGVRLFCGEAADLLSLHDKLVFARAAGGLGLAVPETSALGSEAATALAAGRDHVVKPRFTSSGSGLMIRRAGEPLPQAADVSAGLVQAFVAGEHLSSFSIAREGRMLGTVVYRGLITSGTVSVAFERVERPDAAAWAAAFIGATRHTGFISFDFIAPEGGPPQAIECNPRATSGIHFVEPASLARAILDPAFAGPLALRPQRRMMQFWPCMSELSGAWFNGDRRRAMLHTMRGCSDVTWSLHDPLPLLTMPLTAAGILRRASRRRESFGEAATFDIGWRG